ncbi:cyclic di-GMP phosphodiesterase Gmr [Clostridium homopropionicum DSM 5847]|uniref:Cyclic di-GMP phosphodiesterase Gmr n=1 Tax=Clostridium homopropionicum DSM 5847 TaxID=1121318 RepID=A0A0L6ZAF0_9CLOT|nr:cyclic di-GMP phosphodiesterase Gmr [Clostridium homopropionicum DSM 5847]SFF78370.1 PAS domain S-box-containing protein/diguanylate cyclase (GGDEF) domain-containing protein [Clostridium homopropionicum]
MLNIFKKFIKYFGRNVENDKDINYYLDDDYNIKSYSESIKIAVVYGIVGALWILLSDELLSRIVPNIETFKKLATYKGWMYVVITTILIYSLVLKRLLLFEKAIKKIFSNYEELNASNEELIALQEELKEQFDELEISRNALMISEQRYELAVEGADCGIWDWDVEKQIYYFSEKWKNYLGYEENEINNTFHAFINLIHSSEKEQVIKKLNKYILSQIGSYEDVFRMKCKDGSYKWILSKGKAIWNVEGKVIRVAGSHTDISQQKLIENKLNSLAYFDILTKLPNRVSFEIKVNDLINKKCNTSSKFALIYMDIDNFKNINDTLGHASGDLFLKDISNILKGNIKSPDFVARLSGDEFALIFENVEDRMEVTNRVQDLLKHLRRHWVIDKQEFFISFSLGIAMYPEHGDNLAMLLRNADIAMYFVKKDLKDNYSFYFDEMQEKNLKQIKTISDLYHAIDNKEFILYYQPIIDLKDGKLVGVEALIRWIHPTKGMIPPIEFIPLAEETGLIYDICKWVFNTALMQKISWEQQGYKHIKMSINISGKRITHEKFLEDINQCVLGAGVRCDEIQLEVTETAVIQDLEVSMKILKEIKDMGMKIALDDFGTGYSSLTYIQKLPIDVVKLDRDFIKGISNKGQDNLIIQSIIKLVHDLNLEIVAEGIETKEQELFLKQSNCDYGQGYLFSKPITKEEVEKLFLNNIKEL